MVTQAPNPAEGNKTTPDGGLGAGRAAPRTNDPTLRTCRRGQRWIVGIPYPPIYTQNRIIRRQADLEIIPNGDPRQTQLRNAIDQSRLGPDGQVAAAGGVCGTFSLGSRRTQTGDQGRAVGGLVEAGAGETPGASPEAGPPPSEARSPRLEGCSSFEGPIASGLACRLPHRDGGRKEHDSTDLGAT